MPLIYHVAIEDESVDSDEVAKKPGTSWVGFSTDQISHNLITPDKGLAARRGPGDEPIASEAVASREFHLIKVHKHFRALIDGDDVDSHAMHYLLQRYNNKENLKMTIELQRVPDKGYPTTIVAVKCVARITYFMPVAKGDFYQVNFKIIGGTE